MAKGLGLFTCSLVALQTSRANSGYKRQNLPQITSTWEGLSIPEGVQASKPTKDMKTNVLFMNRKNSISATQIHAHSRVPQLMQVCLSHYLKDACY